MGNAGRIKPSRSHSGPALVWLGDGSWRAHLPRSANRFEVRATADAHFSWIRTRLSLERTMMAWLRTATALIGFGFAIVQSLNNLREIPAARPADLPSAPEYLGLALISCGIVALVIAIWQYQWTLRYLLIERATETRYRDDHDEKHQAPQRQRILFQFEERRALEHDRTHDSQIVG